MARALAMTLVALVALAGCAAPDMAIEDTSTVAEKATANAADIRQQPRTDEVPPPIVIPRPDLPRLSERRLVRKSQAEAPDSITVQAAEVPANPTRILDQAAAERLFGNSGITLQWITWDERGPAFVAVDDGGVWWFAAQQRDESNASVRLEGHITEIGSDHFIFAGEISIVGAPDAGRMCDANKEWRFAITQNRKYWRLREFEWCDGLTDYIDIYF